jgi:hypothetical protein
LSTGLPNPSPIFCQSFSENAALYGYSLKQRTHPLELVLVEKLLAIDWRLAGTKKRNKKKD